MAARVKAKAAVEAHSNDLKSLRAVEMEHIRTVLDACDDVNESLDDLNPRTAHLIATQCQESTARLLVGSKTYVFSTPQKGVDQHNYWVKNDYSRVTLINGGGSVSLQSMAIAMTLGMKALHVFGFDCHITQADYAKGITGVGAQARSFQVEVNDRVFRTTTAYLSFAQQFFKLIDMARSIGMVDSVNVFGDSLVNSMWEKSGESQWLMQPPAIPS